MCRTIQNDKTELKKLKAHIENAIRVYRKGGVVHYNISTEQVQNKANSKAALALSKPSYNGSCMKRKKSAREHQTRKVQRKGHSISQLSQEDGDDEKFLPAVVPKTRSCWLCRKAGHGREKCPELITRYGLPIPTGNRDIRNELVKCLESTTIFTCRDVQLEENHDVIPKLPMHVGAIVLHEKCKNVDTNNFIVQYIVILKSAVLKKEYDIQYFSLETITKWIPKSKDNLIVNSLVYNVEE